jgi:hypothetical protein
MYQLTIARGEGTTTTPHGDFEDAHRMLMSRVIAEDLYLHADWSNRHPATTFKLVKLDEATRRPHVVGTATIDTASAKPVVAPFQSAQAALRWISDHTATWLHGCDTDPGVRYPLAVLTAARAEARGWFRAGIIYPEAARLCDNGNADVPRPRQTTYEVLRHYAIGAGHLGQPLTPGGLAAEVQCHLTAETTPQQTAALSWWTALLMWGVNAP